MDILTNVLRVLMVVATVLNLYGFTTSMRNARKWRIAWKEAIELVDELSEIKDEHVREQLFEAYINSTNKGEEQ